MTERKTAGGPPLVSVPGGRATSSLELAVLSATASGRVEPASQGPEWQPGGPAASPPPERKTASGYHAMPTSIGLPAMNAHTVEAVMAAMADARRGTLTVPAVYTPPPGAGNTPMPQGPAAPITSDASAPIATPERRKQRPQVPPAVIRAEKLDMPAELDRRLVVVNDPGSPRAGAFRALQRSLMGRGNPKSILVTSAGDGEGKSACAANLALSLAESGRHKVLLIDAHVRRPAVGGLFRTEDADCFLDQLAVHRDKVDDPWHVIELDPTGLHVMSIRPAAEKSRALHGPTFAEAMDRLHGSYDYIIVDGATLFAGPDVNLIEDAVDAVLLVAPAGKARARVIKQAIEQLSTSAFAGVVLMENR